MSAPDGERADDLGLGLAPGDPHYRAYVGPPRDYDLVAAMSFGLLTSLGLRQHHRLLDIGCGSLRVGRLLIPYLNRGGYVGLEPNRWLVDEGIRRETGADQIRVKEARIYEGDAPADVAAEAPFDFAFAQSVFSHAGLDVIEVWLAATRQLLRPSGALVATFVEGTADHDGAGWTYPECVQYRPTTIASRATAHGLGFRILDWRHPRQLWALFSRPEFDARGLDDQPLGWNASVRAGRWD